MKKVYKPRNDFVLYRVVDRGHVRGISMPEAAAQGKDLIIEAIGPDVVGLSIGDKVLAVGTRGQDVIEMPSEKGLLLTRQSNVVLIVEDVEEE